MARTSWLIALLLALISLPARAAWIDGGATLTAEAGERAIVGCTPASENCVMDFVDETTTAIAAPGAGLTRFFTFDGELYKRDTADAIAYRYLTTKDRDNDWDVIIDATGKTASAVQDEWYTALEPLIAASCTTLESQLPFRIKIFGRFDDGGDDECDFAEATDFGPARACLAIFKSDTYSGGRPTVDGESNTLCTGSGAPYACCTGAGAGTCGESHCILTPGALTLDISELVMRVNETGATEPMAGFMIGSGFMAGQDAPSSSSQTGYLANIRVIGPLVFQDGADVDSDWTGADVADRTPSLHFSSAADSSSTTTIGLWVNGNPGTIMDLGTVTATSPSNADIDDWAFATQASFSSVFNGIYVEGMNCMHFAAGSNVVVKDYECTSGGGPVSQGMVVGDQLALVPVMSGCESTHCLSLNTGSGVSLIAGKIQAYKHELILYHSQLYGTSNYFEDIDAADVEDLMFGAGVCSSDKSACALDSHCASGTCGTPFGNCGIQVSLHQMTAGPIGASFGPCAQEPFAIVDPANEKRTAITFDGQWFGSGVTGAPPLAVAGHTGTTTGGSADIPVDVSQLQSGFPFPWPASYAGAFIPHLEFIYSTDCDAEVEGQFRQKCIETSVTPHTQWICDPDNAGASAFICDNAADWIQIGGGGSAGNAFTTIDVPSGTDPVADSSTDTLTEVCSNGLTCTGNSGTDTITRGISAGGIADDRLASNYSGTGSCPANQWANTLNDNAAPTCSQPNFTNIAGTIGQSQVPATLWVPRADVFDFDNDGNPEAYEVADGVGTLCTAGNGPCLCFKAVADGGGTQRACINKNGSWLGQDNQANAGGNEVTLLPNDTALATDPSCKQTGTAGLRKIKDVLEGASDRYAICDGLTEIGTLSDRKEVVAKTATGNVGDTGTTNGDEYEVADNIVTNEGAGAGIVLTLPAATAGMCVTFVVVTAQNLDINPNGTNRILGLTDANGDAIRSATIGDTMRLCAVNGTQWASIGSRGTWADVN